MTATGWDTVAEKREDDEEDGEGHALVDSALRLDAVVHHHVPVLSGQDLMQRHKQTHQSDQAVLMSAHMHAQLSILRCTP